MRAPVPLLPRLVLWAQLRSFRLALLAAFQILGSLPLATAAFQRVLGIHKLTELALCSGILTVGIGRATGTKSAVLAVPHLGRPGAGSVSKPEAAGRTVHVGRAAEPHSGPRGRAVGAAVRGFAEAADPAALSTPGADDVIVFTHRWRQETRRAPGAMPWARVLQPCSPAWHTPQPHAPEAAALCDMCCHPMRPPATCTYAAALWRQARRPGRACAPL